MNAQRIKYGQEKEGDPHRKRDVKEPHIPEPYSKIMSQREE